MVLRNLPRSAVGIPALKGGEDVKVLSDMPQGFRAPGSSCSIHWLVFQYLLCQRHQRRSVGTLCHSAL